MSRAQPGALNSQFVSIFDYKISYRHVSIAHYDFSFDSIPIQHFNYSFSSIENRHEKNKIYYILLSHGSLLSVDRFILIHLWHQEACAGYGANIHMRYRNVGIY